MVINITSDLLERISKMPVITKVKISDSSDTSSSVITSHTTLGD